MAGDLQPLDEKFALVDDQGRPTLYFIKWCQQRQIDITEAITLLGLEEYLIAHPLQEGSGIQITPSGSLTDSPTIAADVQEILDQITTTRGSILYRNASDWVALTPGTAGDFLQTNGAGADPAWAAVAAGGGALTLIAESSPSGTGTVSFTSIAATYRDLILMVRGRSDRVATSDSINIRFNNDSGANYARQRIGTDAAAAFSQSVARGITALDIGNIPAASATANYAGHMEALVGNYRNTAFHKSVFSHRAEALSDTDANHQLTSVFTGFWRSTAAINRVDVFLGAGNFVSGSAVSLYGRT